MRDQDLVILSDEVLGTMRRAAQIAIERREPFITPRSILLALLEDGALGEALRSVVDRDALVETKVDENFGSVKLIDDRMINETPAIARYDTLAFKTPDGAVSMWLNREALDVFLEGAQRADERYLPKQLALGVAAEAMRAPGILAAMHLEPGKVIDSLYEL